MSNKPTITQEELRKILNEPEPVDNEKAERLTIQRERLAIQRERLELQKQQTAERIKREQAQARAAQAQAEKEKRENKIFKILFFLVSALVAGGILCQLLVVAPYL